MTEYRTRELHEATAISLFVKITRLEYDPKRKEILFIFPQEAVEYSGKYWDSNLQVDAKAFTTAFKEMKIRLFAFKKQKEEDNGGREN